MKVTLDLPIDLVREMKLRAAHEGRKLRDVATEVVRRGLTSPSVSGGVSRKRVTLPLIECANVAASTAELTPERVAEILLNQEVEWAHEAAGR